MSFCGESACQDHDWVHDVGFELASGELWAFLVGCFDLPSGEKAGLCRSSISEISL